MNADRGNFIDRHNHTGNLQTVSRDILQISHEIAPRSAGLPQREGSTGEPGSVRLVRDSGERPAESGARVRQAVNQPHGWPRVEQGRMAQRSGEDRRSWCETDRQGRRQAGGDHARSFGTRGQLWGIRGTRLCRSHRR